MLPLTLAISLGLLTVVGLLFVPELARLLTSWAGFLAAVALLVGVINLVGVHALRLWQGNVYSAVLIFAMLTIFALALTDEMGLSSGGVNLVFEHLQVPLEAAVAASLSFYLLFAGFRLFSRRRSRWGLLFGISIIIIAILRAPVPEEVSEITSAAGQILDEFIITSGMRGILIGVALGTVVVGIRLLAGAERPYEK